MSLTENIVGAIADDDLLAGWLVTKYGSDQTVQLGVDVDRLPEQGDMPLVIVSEIEGQAGRNLEIESAKYMVTVGIVDDSDPVTVGRVKRYNQVLDLEEFRAKVIAIIEGADLSGGHLAMVELDLDPVEAFPIFSVNMAVTINKISAARSRWQRT